MEGRGRIFLRPGVVRAGATKRHWHALLGVAFALAFPGCAATTGPVLTRATVEGDLVQGRPNGWIVAGPAKDKYQSYKDRKVVHAGSGSASILSWSASPGEYGSFRQVIEAGGYAGKRVRFRAFVRANSVRHGANLWMRADSQSLGSIAFGTTDERGIVGSIDWREYHIVVDVPARAVALSYGVLLHGSGQVWLDDCVIEAVADSVETTAPRTAGHQSSFQRPQEICRLPTNLDFEGDFW